jgi:hypothetical protein
MRISLESKRDELEKAFDLVTILCCISLYIRGNDASFLHQLMVWILFE